MPDGSFQQTFDTITPEQQQAEQAARINYIATGQLCGHVAKEDSHALSVDPGCAGADLWLFDQPNLQVMNFVPLDLLLTFDFSGDELGFGGLCRIVSCGTLTCSCTLPWDSAVQSLWAGSDADSLFGYTSTLLSVRGEADHQVVNEERGDYIDSHKAVKSYILFISDDQFTIDNLFGLDLS